MLLLDLNEAAERGFVDWRDFSILKTLTCINHPTARYVTKNPHARTLHFVRPPEEAPVEGWPLSGLECPCSLDDLRVVIPDEGESDAV